jgi:hypothetical protein
MKFSAAITTMVLCIAGGSPFVGAQHTGTGTCSMRWEKGQLQWYPSSSFLTILLFSR